MKKTSSVILTVIILFAVSITAFAGDDNFVASITAKVSPEIVAVNDGNGGECAALVKDANGNVVNTIALGSLAVTAVSQKDTITDKAARVALEAAFTEIQAAASINELDSGFESIVKAVNPNIDADKYIVRDLFDVSVPDSILAALDGTTYVEVIFKLSALQSDSVFVMTKWADTGWKTIETKNVTINSDGTVTVKFYSFCPVAFIVADPAAVSAVSGREAVPAAATTGGTDIGTAKASSNNTMIYIIAAICVAAIAIVIIIVSKRKKGAQKAE